MTCCNRVKIFTDLQKSDFVNVLSEKMSGTVNGVFHDPCDSFGSMSLESKRAPSLYDCQVKLFREWFSGWSDDQKNYLVHLWHISNFNAV